MTNFDEYGNILVVSIRNNKTVLVCPRDGTYFEPKPDQTLFSTYNAQQDELSKFQNLAKNAPNDPTAILIKGPPCSCGVTYYRHLRLGTSEKSVKICVKCHKSQ
jgi:hypothetical protein